MFTKTIAEQLKELNAGVKIDVKVTQSFEDYLKDVYPAEGVLDDDMPDGFDNWLGGLDTEEIIGYAEDWGRTLKK